MTAPAASPERIARVIGRLRAASAGPTLVCVASIHGNEPAGREAVGRVFRALAARPPAMRGALVGVTGNCAASARGRRFLDADLNRHWTTARIAALTNGGRPACAEDHELLAVLGELRDTIGRARGPLYFVDLHTTSGDSPPFGTVGDTLQNRRFALCLEVPLVLGIEEQLEGTLLEYLNELGHVTLGLEGGQHDAPASADNLEACVWLALAASGVLVTPDTVSEVRAARARLAGMRGTLPRVVEVRHRHPVHAADEFRMHPGFASFERVRAGDVVAMDRAGPVRVPESGRLLMPRYQRQGDDGFFVIREFRPVWLTLSAWLRHLRVDRLLPWLPGVRRDPGHRDQLIVDRRIARWFALQVFHLLGYRKRRIDGPRLILRRRRDDLHHA